MRGKDVLKRETRELAELRQKVIELEASAKTSKQIEEALRKQAEAFRGLAENSPDIIERFDKEIRHIYVNPLAAKLHGFPVEALIGKTNQEIGVPELYWRFWEERIQNVFKTGQSIEEEIEFPTTMGKRIYQSRLVPEKEKDGTVTSVLMVSRDITERKRADEALRRSQQLFSSIFRANPAATILSWWADGRCVDVNEAYAKLVGYTREELIGKTTVELNIWMSAGERQRVVTELAQKGHLDNVELTLRKKTGELINTVAGGEVFILDGQRYILSFFFDITDRKRAEKALQEYQKVVESSQDITAVVDQDYTYLLVNDAFLKYRGMERKQIVGRTVTEVLGKDVFERLIKKNLDTCFQGKVVQFEMKYAYPELGERDLLVSYVPIEGPDGINRAASVIRDITELRRMEETLRESEVRRRLNAQILMAQENERKIIAREIHDGFGSQLAAVKSKVEIFLQQVDKDVVGSGIENLENVIPILQDGIHEARRIQMVLRPSILDDLGILPTLGWLCREYEKTYPNFSIEQEINIEEDQVATPLKIVIYRTLQEAMGNIAKHSKANLVNLSFCKTQETIVLSVRDNGQGFDLKEALTAGRSGQRLGITSMRERVELSGGSLAIESVKGQGTTVRASWPLGVSHSSAKGTI